MDLTNIGFMKIRRQTTVLSIILIIISIYSLFVNKLWKDMDKYMDSSLGDISDKYYFLDMLNNAF